MNWLLRKLGFKVHKWKRVDHWGCELECEICGERQSKYVLWVNDTRMPTWWETTASGDGTCCHTRELPTRIY